MTEKESPWACLVTWLFTADRIPKSQMRDLQTLAILLLALPPTTLSVIGAGFSRSRDEKSASWRLRLGLKFRQGRDQRRKRVVGQEPRALAPRSPLAPGIS